MKIKYYEKINRLGNLTSYAEYNNIEFRKQKLGYYINIKLNKHLHVYFYETENKCSILKGNVIHHVDHNKENNDIINLKLMTKSEHISLHKIGNKNMAGKKLNEEVKKQLSDSAKLRIGELHPRYGKKNSIEHNEKNSKTQINNGKNKGNNNPMASRSVYSIWLEKFGKEIADEKQQQQIEKCRLSKLNKKVGG